MTFRKPYSPHVRQHSITSPGVSLTRGEFRDICDINYIARKLTTDNVIPVPMTVTPAPREPSFGDFSEGTSFESLQQKNLAASRLFDNLPADVRSRFSNSEHFVASLSDPNVLDFLVERGVLSAPPASAPSPVGGTPTPVAVPPVSPAPLVSPENK